MNLSLLGIRLALVLVFAVAAIAKFADRRRFQQSIASFGVPLRFTSMLAVTVPGAELAVAIALLPRASAQWAATGAFALLVAFLALISLNLSKGRRPDCNCFGQLRATPIGWRTLARNIALASLAGIVVWKGPGSSAFSSVRGLSTVEAVSVALGTAAVLGVLIVGWFTASLLRQHGRILLRLDELELAGAHRADHEAGRNQTAGLPVGSVAPDLRLVAVDGQALTLDALATTAPAEVVLIFSDAACGPCNELLPQVVRWQREYAAVLRIAVISGGRPDDVRAKALQHGIEHVMIDSDRLVASAFQSPGTPSAVVIDKNRHVATPVVVGAEAIGDLLQEVSRRSALALDLDGRRDGTDHTAPLHDATVPATGQPAFPFRLPALDGPTVALSDFLGHETLLLFWNPRCGFCRSMLPGLKAWETERPAGGAELLVISSGSEDENRAMGLSTRVLLDPDSRVATSFGALGTPMAVLVDATGSIASPVVAGAQAVFSLMAAHVWERDEEGANA